MRPRGRLWWYRRLRRAYRLHGVRGLPSSRRGAWRGAALARTRVPVAEQWSLPPLRGPRA